MDLVQIATVRALRGWAVDATQDAVLATLITEISARFEADLCGRLAEETERTVQVNVHQGQRLVQLPAFPIDSVSSITNSADRDFSGAAVSTDDYFVQADIGLVHFETGLEGGAGALQIVYTGGLGTSAADVETNFPDIANAVCRQVVYEFERKDSLGQTTQTLGVSQNTKSWATAGGWLPEVQAVLAAYRMMVFG